MGAGAAAAAPYIVAAAGAGAGALNTRRTAQKQDAAAAQGIRQQGARQRQINERVDAELEAVKGSSEEAERRAAADDFMAQLQRTRAQAAGLNPALLAANPRYDTEQLAQNDAATVNAARVADLMTRVAAPILQRQREGSRFAQLGTDVGIIGRAAAGEDFLTRLRMQAMRNNPWIDAAGQTMVGIGGGMATQAPAADPVQEYEIDLGGHAPRRYPYSTPPYAGARP
jgi:hypothetical protein